MSPIIEVLSPVYVGTTQRAVGWWTAQDRHSENVEVTSRIAQAQFQDGQPAILRLRRSGSSTC